MNSSVVVRMQQIPLIRDKICRGKERNKRTGKEKHKQISEVQRISKSNKNQWYTIIAIAFYILFVTHSFSNRGHPVTNLLLLTGKKPFFMVIGSGLVSITRQIVSVSCRIVSTTRQLVRIVRQPIEIAWEIIVTRLFLPWAGIGYLVFFSLEGKKIHTIPDWQNVAVYINQAATITNSLGPHSKCANKKSFDFPNPLPSWHRSTSPETHKYSQSLTRLHREFL